MACGGSCVVLETTRNNCEVKIAGGKAVKFKIIF